MRSLFVASLVLLFAISASIWLLDRPPQTPDKTTQSYIVQADNLDQARSLVSGVGGTITHELRIINAVGAVLSDSQFEALRSAEGLRRIYEDRGVSTTAISQLSTQSAETSPACTLSAAPTLTFNEKELAWTVTNTSGFDLHLAKLLVTWPARNRRLQSIDFNGRRLFSGKLYGISAAFDVTNSAYDDDSDSDQPTGLSITAGNTAAIDVGFARLLEQQDSYELRLFFEEGCSIDFPVEEKYGFEGDSDEYAKRTHIASLTGADALHWEGITGRGVGIAVIDTGLWTSTKQSSYLAADSIGKDRVLAHYDAIQGKFTDKKYHSDKNGHGSHVTSILLSSRYKDSEFNGIAPDANLVVVKAFDSDGQGTYLDVIRALDWVVMYREKLGIRVMNLSFSTEPQSYYWDDPLNQAVMAAWRSGIVVVASAGNTGPAPMTIGVPGNVPYVITVGAMTDNVTPLDWSDDALATFSAAGPTVEAFVKPEIVAPGGHVRGMMDKFSKIPEKHPHYHDGESYYTMSGTSQSAAVVSGAVALLLDAEPWLTPDMVKCKLIATARPARNSDGSPAYSMFQQGAGMVDVGAAVNSDAYNCANVGLEIEADIAGKAHFHGPADQDKAGEFYLADAGGHSWDGTFRFSEGHLWGGGMIWNDSSAWNSGMIWNDAYVWSGGMIWNDAYIKSGGMIWNDMHEQDVTINSWAEPE